MLSKLIAGIIEESEANQPPKKYTTGDNTLSVSAKSDTTSDNTTSSAPSTNKKVKRPASLTQTDVFAEKWFQTMEGKSGGKISAKELQDAFLTFQGKHFSDASCKFVVRLFDLDKNGGLDVPEFEQLYSYVKQWVSAFNAVDRGRNGSLDETQFDLALKEMDINFSSEFIKFLMTRTDSNSKKVTLDQFIVTCVQIQRFTDEFKERDTTMTGNINLKYEDFLEMIMKYV